MITSRILLLDFSNEEYESLKEKFDVEPKTTNWKSGKNETLIPPKDCKIVLYKASSKSNATSLHLGDSKKFIHIVEEGGAIICFIGACEEFHLTNIIGEIPSLSFEKYASPERIIATQKKPLNLIFSRYGHSISFANKLFHITSLSFEKSFSLNVGDKLFGELKILAYSKDSRPVAGMIRKGNGLYLLLPSFGLKNIEVAESFLTEILPELLPPLFYDEEFKWLDKDEYCFPNLIELQKKKEDEINKYKQTIIKLNKKITKIKENEQEPFNKLLKSKREELKQAVINAFKYLGWKKIIDVDEYWKIKDPSRNKEEDIWLFDEDNKLIELKIKKNKVYLLEVKSSKGGATDDDCGVLQKYKARRMQEFYNTNMKAMLI